MSFRGPAASSYHVEISGWDALERFFVENTTLTWSETDGKKVLVRQRLREGTVVFIRLLEHEPSNHAFPVAYRVHGVGLPDVRGCREVTLVQLHPRTANAERVRMQSVSEADTE